MSDTAVAKKSWVDRFLNGIERACNKLPPPAIMFFFFFLIAAVVGAILTVLDVSVINPAVHNPADAIVKSKNLFTSEGLLWLINNLIKNFTGFAPLGLVISMTLAMGLCEETGLLLALLSKSLRNVPPVLIPYVVALMGVIGNIASDAANVVIPPMAAIVYMGIGKHPVAGLITGYAGVGAGFTANIIIAGTDSLLQGITNEAIQGFMPGTEFAVDVTCNWFFMFASTFVVSAVIGTVSRFVVEPRLGKYEGPVHETLIDELAPEQKKGIRWAGISALVYIILIALAFFYGPLAKISPTGERIFVGSPLLKGLIPILLFFFAIPAIVYGYVSGTVKSTADLNRGMVKKASGMGNFIVLCFFAAQFNMLFRWTKLGTMLAICGVNFLKSIGFTGIPMCVSFIILIGVINLFVTSSSAKWALFAPIFVPMFMLLGYHPAFAQLLYRLGDSPSNSCSPMISYLWMILSIAQAKYMKDCKIGTLVSNLVPIALSLYVVWIIFFVLWDYLGLPIGPGVYAELPPGII